MVEVSAVLEGAKKFCSHQADWFYREERRKVGWNWPSFLPKVTVGPVFPPPLIQSEWQGEKRPYWMFCILKEMAGTGKRYLLGILRGHNKLTNAFLSDSCVKRKNIYVDSHGISHHFFSFLRKWTVAAENSNKQKTSSDLTLANYQTVGKQYNQESYLKSNGQWLICQPSKADC